MAEDQATGSFHREVKTRSNSGPPKS
jgi:hypothetical protein